MIVVDEKNRVWFCERTMTSVNDPTDKWKKNTFRFDLGKLIQVLLRNVTV